MVLLNSWSPWYNLQNFSCVWSVRKNMNYQAVLQQYNQISSLLCYRVSDRGESCVCIFVVYMYKNTVDMTWYVSL